MLKKWILSALIIGCAPAAFSNQEEVNDTIPLNEIHLVIEKGERIPLDLAFKSPIARLEGDVQDVYLTFDKRLYITIDNEGLYVSEDDENWLPFEEFFTGSYSAFFSYKLDEDAPHPVDKITLGSEMKVRNP